MEDSGFLAQLPAETREEWFQSFASLQQAMLDHRKTQDRIFERALRHHVLEELTKPCPAPIVSSDWQADLRGGANPSAEVQVDVSQLEPADAAHGVDSGSAVDGAACAPPQPMPLKPACTVSYSDCLMVDMINSAAIGRLRALRQRTAHGTPPRFRDRVEEQSLRAMIWWSALREPPRTSRLARMLKSRVWEGASILAILLNTCFMTWTVDAQMRLPSSSSEFPPWVGAVETFFTLFFSFEIVLKICVHRLYFFCNATVYWNMFDGFLVGLAFLEMTGASESNATFMRSLRVLRITRALRVLKFATQLRCMLQSIMGSVISLFWAFTVIIFIFFLFSLALVQGVSLHMSSPESANLDEDARSMILSQFGSVAKAMYAFQICTTGGDDWINYVNGLAPSGILNVCVFLFGVSFTQIALMNILTGIFVEKAIELAVPDRDARVLQKRRADAKTARELCALLEKLDSDGSGTISRQEFAVVSKDEHIGSLLKVLGVDIRDADMFFDIVARSSEDGEAELTMLMDALMRMKGHATGFDVQSLAYRTYLLSKQVTKIQREMLTRSLVAEAACDIGAVDRSQVVPPHLARL